MAELLKALLAVATVFALAIWASWGIVFMATNYLYPTIYRGWY